MKMASGLLILSESGTKADPSDAEKSACLGISRSYLEALILSILDVVIPFVEGESVLDMLLVPPLVAFLVYKAAAILTERLRMGDDSGVCVQWLRILRWFLKAVNERWGSAG